MPETAIALPLDAEEVIEVIVQELRKRLLALGPLQGAKEYLGFRVEFNHKLYLQMGGTSPKETLAWGAVEVGEVPAELTISDTASYETTSPNATRLEHDLPLTVEARDGRGNPVRRKVKIKADGK